MIGKLLDWAVHNRVVVVLLALALMSVGGYAFVRVNVEAYPDPASANGVKLQQLEDRIFSSPIGTAFR